MALAVNEVLTLSPAGRASREAYWSAMLVSAVLLALGLILTTLLPNAIRSYAETGILSADFLSGVSTAVIVLFFTITLVYLTAAVIRRLHDIGYGAGAALFLIVPGVQIVVLILLGCFAGKKGLNRFGPDPLAVMTISDAVPASPREARPSPVRVVRETPVQEVCPAAETVPPAGTSGQTQTASRSGGLFSFFSDGDLTPEALYEEARFQTTGEGLSMRVQVKTRQGERLRKLLRKGKITQAEFEYWHRRIMALP